MLLLALLLLVGAVAGAAIGFLLIDDFVIVVVMRCQVTRFAVFAVDLRYWWIRIVDPCVSCRNAYISLPLPFHIVAYKS